MGKHATIPYGGETVGWSTIGYWWLLEEWRPVELRQAHGKVDAFRWVYTGEKCEHAGELVQLHLDADYDSIDSTFLDDAADMFPWARVLGVSKGSIVIDLELERGAAEPTAEMVQEAASQACTRVGAGPGCAASAVLRKPRPVSAPESFPEEEDYTEMEGDVEEEAYEEEAEEEPASPTRAPAPGHGEETYTVSEEAAAEENAVVMMASKTAVQEGGEESAAGVSPLALALGATGGLAILLTGALAAWAKLRVKQRYVAKDVEKGVVVEDQKPEAKASEMDFDDNASTATPDSFT